MKVPGMPIRLSTIFAAMLLSVTAAHAASLLYRQTGSVNLGAPDQWDYVVFDAARQRLLVAHSTEITVVDAKTLRIAGNATGLDGAHGIALAPDGLIYADSGHAGSVTAFDPGHLDPVATIPTAPNPDGMSYDPATHAVITVNGKSGSVSVIPIAGAVTPGAVTTIPIGGRLEFASPDGAGHLYVNHIDPPQIVRIDTRRRKVDATWNIPDCTSPHGLAVDPVARRVFASCLNARMMVLDADTGRVVATLPIGRGSDAVIFDPVRHRVFSPNGDGTLSIYTEQDADHFVGETVPTAKGARTGTVDPATGRLFLVTADVALAGAPRIPGGAPSFTFKPGTVKLLTFDPVR
jgi:DNA-binding beta-propeller fold protein YncE